ncbi:helix-turn-helix domain-containing protein [Lapillicoccus sp.]|uniref:PucR family transcriptional regulator n=1 Tax=Lapillicoccus sp. TaxID=1909287 RepID=UPI0027C7FFF1|nr:helix-turn-helix domain-containing protein [Actinomycetota bacterium]
MVAIGGETRDRVSRAAGPLATAAVRRIETDLEWYRALSATDRSWIALVAQAAVGAFVGWLRDTGGEEAAGRPATADVFGTAPRELTWSISLGQTLDLVRSAVDAVEEEVLRLAAPGDESSLRMAVLRYSREVAFAAAQVYSEAAEARGAWDARLEALVVDAVVRAEADDSMQSRATALGWGSVASVTVVVGSTSVRGGATVDALRRAVTKRGAVALAAVQRRRLVVILGGTSTASGALSIVTSLLDHFGDGPVVLGPTVPHLFAAGRSARAALSGLAAAPAWPLSPRPVLADDLLPERVLAGDAQARRTLVDRVHHPLQGQPALLHTASVYLEGGRSMEGAARALFVHPNTVRYRLGKIAELTGYDLAHPREAHTVSIALAVGRLAATPPVEWRLGAPSPARDGVRRLGQVGGAL